MKLTDAEWKIMDVLWDEHPLTAREIMDRVESGVDWAYATVKTLLSRLQTKEAVRTTPRGNINFYEPITTREEARNSEITLVLQRAFDGALGPLMHFLVSEEKLSSEDRKALLRLLQDEKESE
jgi:BlaI family transcriptional regulator, penicillinase repressor